jgi:diguanylate cyclase (GGDEF)-like protein
MRRPGRYPADIPEKAMAGDIPDGNGPGGAIPGRSKGITTEIASAEIKASEVYGDARTPVLSVVAGAQVGMTVLLNGSTLTIGRDAASDIPLIGSGISRNHCRIERRSRTTFIISDLNSTNGMFVNGSKSKVHELVDGDLIKLGPYTVLKYCIENTTDVRTRIRHYEQSIHDDLTGLFNRRYFDSRFRHEFAYAKRHGDLLSVILFDLDRFKDINDEFGHAAGDFVIQRLAARLSGHLRSEDILARYGGEEFAIILRGHNERQAYLTAERVRTFIEGLAFPLGESQRSLTISLGTSTLGSEGPSTVDDVIAEADKNLYEAKSGGRNRTVGTWKA